MPITTQQFTLAENVRQRIVAPDVMNQQVIVHNHEHAQNKEIFIGNSGVTTTNGLHARSTETLSVNIGPGDDLWAVSDDNNVVIHVLVVKQD